jgi:hypothetical protein
MGGAFLRFHGRKIKFNRPVYIPDQDRQDSRPPIPESHLMRRTLMDNNMRALGPLLMLLALLSAACATPRRRQSRALRFLSPASLPLFPLDARRC